MRDSDDLVPSLCKPPPPPHLLPSSYKLQQDGFTDHLLFSGFSSKPVFPEKIHEEVIEFPSEGEEEHEEQRQRGSRCSTSMCCAWMIFGSFAFSLALLLLGLLFMSTLRSGLPKVRVLRFDFPKPNVSKSNDTIQSADFRAQIEIWNENESVDLHYSSLLADVLSENIELGKITIPKFSQKAKNRTVLKVSTTVKNLQVNEDDVRALKANAANHQIVFSTVLSGKISFHYRLLKINSVPILIACHDIRQADLDLAMKPECRVKIFTFRA